MIAVVPHESVGDGGVLGPRGIGGVGDGGVFDPWGLQAWGMAGLLTLTNVVRS